MRKVEITVEERIKRKISYDFILPEHVSENQMNIIIARVESRSDCADDENAFVAKRNTWFESAENRRNRLGF